ncbi:hypothetical protein GEV33_008200 [Tenebrio molitor]|uniref:Carboxylesterase type B domain-containing protein n=1 Tax=Tenebrio molitor TaxID=7067 RepID=A0A8J6HHP7_TENMO|nr:hypothetical protein GEV33_008200 [Tenebrio molitor]
MELLIDDIKTELQFVGKYWRLSGRPTVCLLIREEHMRDPQFKKMLDLLAMLKKGYCDGVKVRVGRLQNLISSSCVEHLDFMNVLDQPNDTFVQFKQLQHDYIGYQSLTDVPRVLNYHDELKDYSHFKKKSTQEIIEAVKHMESLYARCQLFGILLKREGATFEVFEHTVEDHLHHLYHQAGCLRHWAAVRYTSSMLSHNVDSISPFITAVLVHGKQLTVGVIGQKETVFDKPMTPAEIQHVVYNTIQPYDVIQAVLQQEVILYCGRLIATNPELFKGILKIRVGWVLEAIKVYLVIFGDKRKLEDHSPYEVRQLLYKVLSIKEWGAKEKLTPFQKRQLEGCLCRVPSSFYHEVWDVMTKTSQGIRIMGTVLPQQPTLSNMARSELTFSLLVEQMLNCLHQPQYRQLVVELLCIVSTILGRNPELTFSQPLDLEQLIKDAAYMYSKASGDDNEIKNLMEVPCMQSTGYLARAVVNTVLKGGQLNDIDEGCESQMLAAGFCFVAVVTLAAGDGDLEVAVAQGLLRGTTKTTRGGRSFGAFEGIPFAQPPLGELRFKAPVPVQSWQGVKDATKPHNICPQRDIYRRSTVIEGNEDCLYLNVYTPQDFYFSESAKTRSFVLKNVPQLNNTASRFPVMIFFHGGGWLCGGGNSLWYGPDILLDRDVILVVTNYRLGPLGFLSTGDAACPGNNGMKDQNLAMRWVKDNVAAFGGDPEKITIFGESAGGASAQLHMMSPLSKGRTFESLFRSAISQSGTAHVLWAVSPNDQAIRHAKMLGEAVGCSTKWSGELVECLRKVPAYDLVAQDNIFMKWDTDPMIPFKPVIEPDLEGAFLVEHPIDSFRSGRFAQVPWIVGLNTEDGALRAAGIFGNPHLIGELDEKFEQVVPISLLYDETSPQSELVTSQIKNFYFGGGTIDNSSRGDVVDMYTDGWFLNGADEAIRYYLKYSRQPVYYYLFGHRGVASFTEIFGDKNNDYGVCHADELQYLFPIGDGLFPGRPPSPGDKKIAEIMTTLWVNFAQTG